VASAGRVCGLTSLANVVDRQEPRATRLEDVARLAGVSLSTASRVLNGSTRQVSAEMSRRVLEAARKLGYTPNVHAQAVARGTSNLVGLVVHDIADPYFSSIAAGVMRVADEHGLVVTVCNTIRDPDREIGYVALLRAQRARAVILVGSRFTDKELLTRLANEIDAFRRGGGRVACVSQRKLAADTVLPENRAGARALARDLVGLGHRRFAVLAGPETMLTARDRLAGFRDGLAAAGISLERDQIVHGAFTRDGGYAAAEELIRRGLDVTCVFAVNDVMAVGAIAAFRAHGVTVPADVSVAGFDDIVTLRDLVPSLTTVHLPLEEMGVEAARLAFGPEPGDTPRLVRVPGEVVLRESTRRLT